MNLAANSAIFEKRDEAGVLRDPNPSCRVQPQTAQSPEKCLGDEDESENVVLVYKF